MEVMYTANFQPDLVLSGFRIGEPVIALTSLLVSAVCFYVWGRLKRIESPDPSVRLGRIFFLLLSVSTFLGSLIGHAFMYTLPFVWKLPGWTLSMVALSAFQQATIVRYREMEGADKGRWLTWMNTSALTLGLWFVSSTLWFPAVEIHSAFGFLCMILPLEIFLWRRHQNSSSKYMMYGIAFLVGAVLIHILKWSLGVWFSFFDIGHLFMCAAMLSFMYGFERHQRQADNLLNGETAAA